MVVINAIVYKSEEDGGYVAMAYEVTQIGVGETKEGAIGQLEKFIKLCIDTARQDPGIVLTSNPGDELLIGLTRVMTEARRYKPIIREINDYGLTLHIYDSCD